MRYSIGSKVVLKTFEQILKDKPQHQEIGNQLTHLRDDQLKRLSDEIEKGSPINRIAAEFSKSFDVTHRLDRTSRLLRSDDGGLSLAVMLEQKRVQIISGTDPDDGHENFTWYKITNKAHDEEWYHETWVTKPNMVQSKLMLNLMANGFIEK